MFQPDSGLLMGVGRVGPDPTWSTPVHAHAHWEFIYFVRGTGQIDLPEATLRAQQYHLVVYPPGLPHAEVSDPTDPEETVFLTVRMDGSPPLGAHLVLPDQQGRMGWLCREMFDEWMSFGSSELAQTYARAFLHLVHRAWRSGVPIRHDAVDLAMQYIHANLAGRVSLDELARTACVSKVHLAHCFKDRVGTSPLRYLRDVRVETAKRLLLTTDMPVNAVAAAAGFADPYYFSRVIKSTTGHSPTSFRRTPKATV